MESDTQQIALGLRQGDVVVLETLSSNTNIGLFAISFACWARRDGVDDLGAGDVAARSRARVFLRRAVPL